MLLILDFFACGQLAISIEKYTFKSYDYSCFCFRVRALLERWAFGVAKSGLNYDDPYRCTLVKNQVFLLIVYYRALL